MSAAKPRHAAAAAEIARARIDRLQAAFDAAPVGVVFVDAEPGQAGEILEANSAFGHLVGYDPAELAGKHVLDLTHPDDRALTQIRLQESAEGKTCMFGLDKRYLRRDGSPVWCAVHVSVIRRKGARTFNVAHVMEITDRKQAEAILKERLDREVSAQRTQRLEALAALAGGIAHDFNNLLLSIIGHCGLLARELPRPGKAYWSVTEIERAAQRAADLTRQMLAYSGRGQFSFELLDVSELLHEMAEFVRRTAHALVEVHVETEAHGLWIEADRGQIQQIMVNLLTNAAEAIGAQHGVITLRAGAMDADRRYLDEVLTGEGLALPAGRYVFLEITDTGPGMDEATLRRMFDPFFSTKFLGRGLGLAAVEGIVRAHHGGIHVRTAPSAGTSVRVLLPAANHVVSARGVPHAAAPAPSSEVGCVLVVDDEDLVRNVIRELLEAEGYRVLLAPDGQTAIDCYRHGQPRVDLVLLDLTMPGWTGATTLEELQQQDPNVRVVLMSGYDAQQVGRDFAGRGVIAFLQKPFRPQALLTTVSECMPARNAPKESL